MENENKLYKKEDLVKFGEYLLSEKRKNRIASDYDVKSGISFDERLKTIYDLDLLECFFIDKDDNGCLINILKC